MDLIRSLDLRSVVVAGLLLTYIWRFHVLTPELDQFRLAALFTVSTWAFLLLAPRWPVLKRALSFPYIWLFLVWTVWTAIGIPFSLSPPRAWAVFHSEHLKNVAMILFLVVFFRTLHHVRFVLAVHFFGAAVLTFYYAKGGFPTWGSPVPMYDRNDFALLIVMTAPLVLFISLATKEKLLKVGAWLVILGIVVGVIWGQSRGGFLALCAASLYLLLRLQGIRPSVRILLPLLVVFGVLLAPPESKDRLGTLLAIEEDYNIDSETGRIEIWKRGLGYMRDNPVFGVGFMNFPVAEGTLAPRGREGDPEWKWSVAHNSFLEVAAETGVVGGILFVGILISALWRLARIRSRFSVGTDPHSTTIRQLCDCVSASIIGWAVAGFFLSQAYHSLFYSLIALVAGVELSASRLGVRSTSGEAHAPRSPRFAARPNPVLLQR